MSEKITCTVKRSTWSRGGKNGPAKLLNSGGNMCCLGFLGEACGITPEALANKVRPDALDPGLYTMYPILTKDNIYWAVFANINDDKEIDDTERESQLTKLAEENGFTFVFVD